MQVGSVSVDAVGADAKGARADADADPVCVDAAAATAR